MDTPLLNQGTAGRLRRTQWLAGVVLHDVAHQDIGIQADHPAAAPRAAIALFMSSIDTRFFALPNMPFSSVTEWVAAMTSNRPGSTSTNSTRSPGSTCNAWRTLEGIVIWPLLVTVAVV